MDKNKVFFVNFFNLIARIDPYYHRPDFLSIRKKLINNPLFNRIGRLILSWNRGDGPRDGFYTDDYQNGVYFLRVNNLKEHTINLEDVKYITRYVHENTLKRSQVTAGDVVFAISGTKENLGTVSIIPDHISEANLNSALVTLKLDWSVINKKYFCYMFDLNITRVQIEFIGKGTAQNNLNNEEISEIHIFLPSIKKQLEIVDFLDKSYLSKKQKELEAQRLLDSIDDYLLGELGIELPEPEENTIKNRIFIRNLSEVSGDRFDCNYNHKINYILSQTGNYKIEYLKNLLIKPPQYGANEIAIDKNNSGEINYIRITDIDDLGFLKVRGLKTALKIEDKYILNQHDLLFARSGSVGRCYLHQDNKQKAIFAGYLIRFVLNTQIANPYYIFYYCHSKIYKMWVDAISRYAVQSNINSEEYKSLPIILPPLEKQIEISEHITAIRNQAKQLQQQAKDDLEKAKQEVEAMILGDD